MGEFISALGNPWMPAEWNLTTQGRFIERYGAPRAAQYAKLAGSFVGATEPNDPNRKPPQQVFIFRKAGGGGGLVGAGSAGNGPPSN